MCSAAEHAQVWARYIAVRKTEEIEMTVKLLVAAALGLLLGIAAPSGLIGRVRPPDMRPRWEYKAVEFLTNPDRRRTAAHDLTAELARLNRDGWEYVGPLTSSMPTGEHWSGHEANCTYVAFKRARR